MANSSRVMDIVLTLSDDTDLLLRSVRMQLSHDDRSWRKDSTSDHSTSTTGPSPRPNSRRERMVPSDDSMDDFEGSKLFIFTNASIYVILSKRNSCAIELKFPNLSIVTDHIKCERSKSTSHDRMTLTLLPNKNIRGSSVRIRKLERSDNSPAGIPLDQAGLDFRDIQGPSFISHKAVYIKFNGGHGQFLSFVLGKIEC